VPKPFSKKSNFKTKNKTMTTKKKENTLSFIIKYMEATIVCDFVHCVPSSCATIETLTVQRCSRTIIRTWQ
jgi:hypothetical protein